MNKKINKNNLIKNILKDKPENIKFYNQSLPNFMKYIYYDFNPYSFLMFKNLIFSPPNNFAVYEDLKENFQINDNRNNKFRQIH